MRRNHVLPQILIIVFCTIQFVATACVIQFVDTTKAAVANWPQFRGHNSSGIAAEGANPPVRFSPRENVVWKTALPAGLSSPCIWGNNIFITGFEPEEKKFHTICINRNTGIERWRSTIQVDTVENVHMFNNPANATPATNGEHVYVYFASYGLLCYDIHGKKEWALPLPIPKTKFGTGTSSIVCGDLVILNRDELENPKLLAVTAVTGEIVWEKVLEPPRGASSYSTPVIWKDKLIVHRKKEVVTYSSVSGERNQSISIVTGGTSTPVLGDSLLFVGAWTNLGESDQVVEMPSFENLIEKFDSDQNSVISQKEFPDDFKVALRPEVGNVPGGDVFLKPFFATLMDTSKNGSLEAGEWQHISDIIASLTKEHGLTAIKLEGTNNTTLAVVKWQQNKNVPEVPSPLYYHGRVYMVKNGGIVTCLDAKSGKLKYCERLGARGAYFSSPVVAQNRVYIASYKGVVTVFKTGDEFEVLAQNDLGEFISATPAVVEDNLYVRTEGYLYAFGK